VKSVRENLLKIKELRMVLGAGKSIAGIAILGCASMVASAQTAEQPVTYGEIPSKSYRELRSTFYGEILPILQENCQVCHRPNGANLGGMVAPMAFTDYETTRPWAKAIAKNVVSGYMPPWHAAPEHTGVFRNERTLTQGEIDLFVKWADTGAMRGNPKDAPEPVAWPSSEGWIIGEPDLIVKMPEPYFVADDVVDQYVNFRTELTEEMLPEDRWIQAMEFRPGSSVVHHIIAPPLGGIAPGNEPTVYRDGLGRKLEKGTSIRWQMHYHKEAGEGTGVWDQSMVALKFYPKETEITQVIGSEPLGRFDFRIPPGAADYSIQTEHVFDHDVRMLHLMPHMHLRGKSAKYEVTYPDGTHEVLLDVPRYDFNWQTAYEFAELKDIPKGSKLVFTTTWDNSANNPFNPDPTQTVRFGEPTTDEMSFGFMQFVYANPADAPSGSGGLFGDQRRGGGRGDRQRGGRNFDIGAMLEAADANGDGQITKSEMPERMQGFFDRMDLNGDGVIDEDEIELVKQFAGGQRGR
jgi:hypothetical protein